jgi:hypothetical protein
VVRLLALLSMLTGCGRLGFGLFSDTSDPDAALDGAGGDGSGDASADAPPAGGPLTQQSAMFNGLGAMTLTLPAPSTAGSLLVITMTTNDTSNLVLPTGFTVATSIMVSGGGFALIAYQADNPGGVSNVMVTQPTGLPSVAQLSEWMGITSTSPDVMGSSTGPNSTMLTVQTAAATTAANDVALAVFCQDVANPTYTAEAGWSRLGTASNTSAYPSYSADYRTNVPVGIASETVTSTVSGKYAAVIVAFRTQ